MLLGVSLDVIGSAPPSAVTDRPNEIHRPYLVGGACSLFEELLVEITVLFDALREVAAGGRRGRPEYLEHPAWAFSISLPHICRRP